MRKIIWKRRTWKWIGLSISGLVLLIACSVIAFWWTYVRMPFPKENVYFESLGNQMAGTLMLPNKGEGPFPAILVLPGSGRITRDHWPLKVQCKAFLKMDYNFVVESRQVVLSWIPQNPFQEAEEE